MPAFTIKRHVAAPSARVFAYATDFARLPERIGAITGIELLTAGPIGVGTRYRETRRLLRREATEVMEVVAFDPPHGYAVVCASHGHRYRTTVRCTQRTGHTELELRFEAEPLTWTARAMGIVFRPLIAMCARETAKDLDDLKVAVEGDLHAAAGAAAAE